eukprot:scaffold8098_cov67-Cyclotella_meneghiniana.AAC.2
MVVCQRRLKVGMWLFWIGVCRRGVSVGVDERPNSFMSVATELVSLVPSLLQSIGTAPVLRPVLWVVLLSWGCGDWYGSGETCGLMAFVRPGGVGWLWVCVGGCWSDLVGVALDEVVTLLVTLSGEAG